LRKKHTNNNVNITYSSKVYDYSKYINELFFLLRKKGSFPMITPAWNALYDDVCM